MVSIRIFPTMFVCLFLALPASAATYFVSPTGNNANNGSSAQPWKTLAHAFLQGGGHTYVLKDGTYDYGGMEITSPPSGTAAAYTVIKAENAGGALLLNRTIDIASINTSYIRFEGLRWKGSLEKKIKGHHLKFLQCSFEDGPMITNNVKNTTVGNTDDGVGATHDILLEDCIFFGRGGRYELLVQNSNRVVVRRAVIRHDGGWPGFGSDPEAGITFYNSTNCAAQNVIVLDSPGPFHLWRSAFYAVHHLKPGITLAAANYSYQGCMALWTEKLGFAADGGGTIPGITIQDSVFWDNKRGGLYFDETGKAAQITNVTIGAAPGVSTYRGIVDNGGAADVSAKNVIVAEQTDAFRGLASVTWYDCWSNDTCTGGTGGKFYNPLTSGLLHLYRIEPNTPLSHDGEGGGRLGANMTTRIGASGTYHGDPGWNSDTGTPLWPWFDEDRVAGEMCANSSIGFCGTASQSLTNYICSYLGNSCATGDTQPPSVPAGAAATALSSSSIRVDWNASTDNAGVAGYRLDVSTSPAFDTFVAGYQNRDAGNALTHTVTGLVPGTTYYARVRAYDAVPNTSGSSATAFATTMAGGSATRVIAVGDVWRYFKGTTAPPANWHAASFVDSAWPSGATGIGYGDTDDATVLQDMQNSYWSVYTRRAFILGNPASVTGMTLVIDWDDGFVAYLNGVEVARSNMGSGAPTHTTPASPFREAGTPQSFDLGAFTHLLVTGLNVLAIEVHNDALDSTDLSLLPNLDLLAPGDVVAPSTPGNVAASALSSSELSVSWTASTDNVAVTGYRIDVSTSPSFTSWVAGYQDRDLGNVTSTVVNGLAASTQYHVRLRAYDAAGNRSLNSATAPAVTQSTSTTQRVIAVGDTWKYFKGTSEPPASWKTIAFNDAAWASGQTGIGYGDGDDATVLTDMQNNYLSVFARKTFNVADPASVAGLSLVIDWDDGYVAWLNGTEVARANMTGTPAYNIPASNWREAGTYVTVDLSAFRSLLVTGTNVLAIQIHNDELPSSDLSLKPALDLRIPEVVIRVGDVWKYFKGTAAPPAGWNGVSFNDASWPGGQTGIGYGDADDATVLTDMQNNYVSVHTRRAFTVNDAALVTRLTMTIDFDDGYVAYLNGTEVARSNMPAGTPAHTTLATPFHEAGTPVTVDLTAWKHLLTTGTNVLAIEVHNEAVASTDLSLIPSLSVER